MWKLFHFIQRANIDLKSIYGGMQSSTNADSHTYNNALLKLKLMMIHELRAELPHFVLCFE